jgi:hypothetical protein
MHNCMFRDLNNNHIGIYVEDELHLLVLSYLHVLQLPPDESNYDDDHGEDECGGGDCRCSLTWVPYKTPF